MKLSWNKNPSVTTGGKHYFYTTRDRHGAMWTVVWDRYVRRWSVSNNQSPDMDYFDTATKGRQFVKEVLDVSVP